MGEQLTGVDKAKNRVYIYFQGWIDLDHARRLQESYKQSIQQVQPGYTVLTYAQDFLPAGPDVQAVVMEMTQMAEKAGLKKVARVVGSTPLGGLQINRLAKMHTSYPARHFATEAEAEAYLDSDDL